MVGRGKALALFAGAAAFLTLAGGVLFEWREFAARYHLVRLTAKREYLLDCVDAPAGSPQYVALRRYASTPEGKSSLLETYLDAVFSTGQDFRSRIESVRTYRDGAAWLQFWATGGQVREMSCRADRFGIRGGGGGFGIESLAYRGKPLGSLLASLQRILVDVGYDHHPFPADPQLTFSVIKRHEVEDGIVNMRMHWVWFDWSDGHFALVEQVGPQSPHKFVHTPSTAGRTKW